MKQLEFKAKMANRYCRKCINEELGIKLQNRDCCYMLYPNECQRCKEVRNIVDKLHWSARYKFVFARSKDTEK